MELIGQAKIDYFALNCYRSNVAKHCPKEESYLELALNKEGKKGQSSIRNFRVNMLWRRTLTLKRRTGIGKRPGCDAVYAKVCLGSLPPAMMITENGLGAHEQVGPDGQVHDANRIAFLRDQVLSGRSGD